VACFVRTARAMCQRECLRALLFCSMGTLMRASSFAAAESCVAVRGMGQPTSPEAYRQRADVYRQRGEKGCAADALEAAARLLPSDASLQLSFGQALYEASRVERAREVLEHAALIAPTSVETHLALGVVEHDLGNRDLALREWEHALQLDPSSAIALDWVSKARIEAGQYTAAVDLLLTAARDENAEVDLLLARSHAGMADQSIAPAMAALARHPGWLKVRLALAVVLTQRNRYQDAADLLKPALTMEPGDQDLQLENLRVLVLKGDLAEAKPASADYLKRFPNSFDGLYLAGLIQRKEGQYEAAIAELSAAIAQRPKHFDVLFNLGASEIGLKRWSAAKQHLEAAVALNPGEADAHFQLGTVLRATGDEAGAKIQLTAYQKCLRDRSRLDRDVSLASQASDKMRAGDAAAAILLYHDLLQDEPDNPVTWYNLAMVLDDAKDTKEEETALETAIRLRKNFAAAENQLGYLQAAAGRNREAELSFRAATSDAPQYAEADNNLGSLLASEGKDQLAEQYFRSAVDANPRLAEAWTNLAAVLAQRSDFRGSREAVQKALLVEPTNPTAAALLKQLPPLGGGRNQ